MAVRRTATTRTRDRPGRPAPLRPTCVVVRILDPRRTTFYAERGLRTVCPTQTTITTLTEGRALVRTSAVGVGELMIRDRRRRREGRREHHTVAPSASARRSYPRRAASRAVRAARGRVRPRRARGRCRAIQPVLERAGITRPPELVLAHHRATSQEQHRHRPIAQDGSASGRRSRGSPTRATNALRPARDHPDGLRDVRAMLRPRRPQAPSTAWCGSSSSTTRAARSSSCQVPAEAPAAGERLAAIALPEGRPLGLRHAGTGSPAHRGLHGDPSRRPGRRGARARRRGSPAPHADRTE